MKPVTQTRAGSPTDPDEEKGDCLAACIASILEIDIEDCRSSFDDDWIESFDRMLARHNLSATVLYTRSFDAPNAYWIASVPSRRLGTHPNGYPVLHAIVMHGGKVMHDPTQSEALRHERGTQAVTLDIRSAIILSPLWPEKLARPTMRG